ncbi:fungal-specific transcription factor domain-domain-containing protein [Yarrowia lipolytica]|uniref:Fungal-specific transcription factor domain-domain-containing protein n=1 Tax=Yarrowia lipolytica TaxID=4952 RepID=A0A371CFU8_YARLL|nr:fungal-specific transcription factor domain-containing protein [Yarrowia lipolytica]KAE8171955.1 fungal-specific transcription factor domain-containing protein [Yarrowia lipolytica]RDW29152.1 fungal-specific transcription factor domain-domain-containing protein [Yarrowia lipolytica]RDW35053.1 fungal-specific transcription factor domain-domain-containing protein [Yarrowia lipolytica]RDW42625.1 fungal-specific transcription factor domain-domain-containing protein [Yarrowia lipolytica]
MNELQFVVETGDVQSSRPASKKPKRTRRACLPCQGRKIRCNGGLPCETCIGRKVRCEYKDEDTKKGTDKSPSPAKNEVFENRRLAQAQSPHVPHTQSPLQSHVQVAQKPAGKSPHQPAHMSPHLSPQAVHMSPQASHMSPHTQPVHVQQHTQPPQSQPHTQQTKPQVGQTQPQSQPPAITSPLSIATSSSRGSTRQPYFRWLGATAIAPPRKGKFRLIAVNLASSAYSTVVMKQTAEGSAMEFQAPITSAGSANSVNSNGSYFPTAIETPETQLPSIGPYSIPTKYIDVFYSHVSSILPYLPRKVFNQLLQAGEVSEALLNAMAGLGLKMSSNSSPTESVSETENTAIKYSNRAKELVIRRLALPTVETVYTLLLIAYNEFANDMDSGLWMWSGMAIRMCFDLGLHKADLPNLDEEHRETARNVFWSVVCLDRLISSGTGRTVTVPLSQIEHHPPVGKKLTTGQTDPFPYLCKLLLLVGKVTDHLNSVDPSQLSSSRSFASTQLASFHQDVSDFYTSLPPDLLFDVHNFQEFARIRQSQVFLLLHVWNQALILAVYHPTVVYARSAGTLGSVSVSGSSNVSLNNSRAPSPTGAVAGGGGGASSSAEDGPKPAKKRKTTDPPLSGIDIGAISISDMVAFADLIDPLSFLCSPFASQPLLMAGVSCLTVLRALSPANTPPHAIFTVKKSYHNTRNALQRLRSNWAGVSWLCETLDSLEREEEDVDLVGSFTFEAPEVPSQEEPPTGSSARATATSASINHSSHASNKRWLVDALEENCPEEEMLGLVIAGSRKLSLPIERQNEYYWDGNGGVATGTSNNGHDQVPTAAHHNAPRNHQQPRNHHHNNHSTNNANGPNSHPYISRQLCESPEPYFEEGYSQFYGQQAQQNHHIMQQGHNNADKPSAGSSGGNNTSNESTNAPNRTNSREIPDPLDGDDFKSLLVGNMTLDEFLKM